MTKLLVFNKSQRVRYFSVSVLFHTSLICWRLKRFCRLRLFLINGGGTLLRGRLGACAGTPHQVVKRFFILLALFNSLAWTITDSQWHESLEKKMYGNAQMCSRQCNPVIHWAQIFLTANFSKYIEYGIHCFNETFSPTLTLRFIVSSCKISNCWLCCNSKVICCNCIELALWTDIKDIIHFKAPSLFA